MESGSCWDRFARGVFGPHTARLASSGWDGSHKQRSSWICSRYHVTPRPLFSPPLALFRLSM
eukprot:1525862-Amphidinium_carterae.1